MSELVTEKGRRFNGLQVLRLVACLSVLLFHITLLGANHHVLPVPVWYGGMAGVDVFFVLSGFVMLYSADRLAPAASGWRTFLLHRLFRVVPMYWLFTLVFLLIGVGLSATAVHQPYLPRWVLGSLMFWPVRRYPGDLIVSVCPVGWTLVFEMLFYLTVTFALAVKRSPLWICTAIMLVLASFSSRNTALTGPTFFLDPIVLEFVFGMLVYRLYSRGYTMPRWAAWMLVPACLLILGLMQMPRWRVLSFGLPAALLVASFVSLEKYFARTPRSVLFLADATYALYLLHVGVIEAVMRWAQRQTHSSMALVFVACVSISIGMAAALRRWLEAPLYRALLRRWGSGRIEARSHTQPLPMQHV